MKNANKNTINSEQSNTEKDNNYTNVEMLWILIRK